MRDKCSPLLRFRGSFCCFALLTGFRHALNSPSSICVITMRVVENCPFLLLIEAVGVTGIIDTHHSTSIDIYSVAELDNYLLPHHSSFHILSQKWPHINHSQRPDCGLFFSYQYLGKCCD